MWALFFDPDFMYLLNCTFLTIKFFDCHHTSKGTIMYSLSKIIIESNQNLSMTDNFKLNKVAKANRARQHFGGHYYHFIIIKGCLLSRVRNILSVNVIDSMQCTAYKKNLHNTFW